MQLNIGLSHEHRQGVTEILTNLLAEEYVLYTKTRNYHGNVVGPQFNDLHEFFEMQYRSLNGEVDDIAERIRILGGPVTGTLAEFAQRTRLKEHPGHYPEAQAMLADLLADHELLSRQLRMDLETCAEEYPDMGTNDFLMGLMERHEKMAWMRRSFAADGIHHGLGQGPGERQPCQRSECEGERPGVVRHRELSSNLPR
jgi:starvation-inducible DNA-binding protein